MIRPHRSTRNRRPDFVNLEPRVLLSRQSLPALAATAAPAITLHLSSVSSPMGDSVAFTQKNVVLEGIASPGAWVRLTHPTSRTRQVVLGRVQADASGHFQFSVKCPLGKTQVQAQTIGSNGRLGTTSLVMQRTNQAVSWNTVALQAVRATETQAPQAARAYAIVALSVYDAVNAVTPIGASYGIPTPTVQPGTSADAAAASAAYTALVGLFPSLTNMLTQQYNTCMAAMPNTPGRAAGIALGTSVAQQILSLRGNDGSNAAVPYHPAPGPDVWVPTPPAYAPPLAPGWGSVTPFALTSNTQFQAPPPPAPTSTQFAREVAQVEAIGGTQSTLRTPQQTEIAHFWSDLAGTFDPPGHWNHIADTAAIMTRASLQKSARTLALVDLALADAGIMAWSTKYTYNTARPVTVIRTGLAGINPGVMADPTWTPLWATPPFPSYVSGHSTFSAAASAVLNSIYGRHFAFVDTGDPTVNLAPRSFQSFDQAAHEAGMSRIYGGIHFMSDNLAGLALGTQIGRYVATHELSSKKATNSNS